MSVKKEHEQRIVNLLEYLMAENAACVLEDKPPGDSIERSQRLLREAIARYAVISGKSEKCILSEAFRSYGDKLSESLVMKS